MNFKNEKTEKLYNERLTMIKTTADHKEPKRVPITTMMDMSWPAAVSNVTYEQLKNDIELEKNVYTKVFQDIHLDAFKEFGNRTRNYEFYDILGKSTFRLSDDGITPVHAGYSGAVMEAEDYPQFIADPVKYLDEVFFPRKFERLRQDYPETKAVLKKALESYIAFRDGKAELVKYVVEELGYPFTGTGTFYLAAFDPIFDYLRGFENALNDMRRHPEELKNAAMSFADNFIVKINNIDESKYPEGYPWRTAALHAPLYLSPKQFEKFYWPPFKKVLMGLYAQGTKARLALEGSWLRFTDFLKELPDNLLLCGEIASEDFLKFEEILGSKVTLIGGMPNHLVKYGTYDQCVERIKEVFDKCAPGGGFMFSLDDSLMVKSDVNYELYCKVNEFAIEYGKY